ncbi:MAG: 2-C-methyl-D-erythritol 2,4-cyclodiphosphate synthase [Magnetococcales bacterium]|nr:2-C-methyl-D-erythritol 2,4-cyclodiphosphate synthase [Magnetococcales bacterium]
MRIGQGIDIHPWVSGRPLRLGGVTIPHSHGLLGHSDADALLHAICDALLGAAALGDIGHHFPDHDPAYRGMDSNLLLDRVVVLVAEAGWRVVNLDCTVLCQRPKLAPYREAMRLNIAERLGVELSAVNVKATTTEQLGFVGREEGLVAMATVLLG